MKCTMCLSRENVIALEDFFVCPACIAAMKAQGLVSMDGRWIGTPMAYQPQPTKGQDFFVS